MHQLLLALRRQTNVLFLRGEVVKARRLADRELALARERDEATLPLGGYRSVGMCSFFVGEFQAARENQQHSLAIYDPARHHAQAYVHGTDPAIIAQSVPPGVSGFSVPAWTRTRRCGPPSTWRTSMPTRSARPMPKVSPPWCTRGDGIPARRWRERRNQSRSPNGTTFPTGAAWYGVLRGWALAVLGEAEQGIEVLAAAHADYEATGAQQITPHILTLLAAMEGWAGRSARGLEVLARAFEPGNTTDVSFYEAESQRLAGELRISAGLGDGRAEFTGALATARRKGARGLKLRAAISAGRVLLAAGQRREARNLLPATLTPFPFEADDADVVNARRLLDEASA